MNFPENSSLQENYIRKEELKLPEDWTLDKGKTNFILHNVFSEEECKKMV
jgi:hypothetical protein